MRSEGRGGELEAEIALRLRQEKAKPLLDSFRDWLTVTRTQVLDQGPMARAIDYTLSNWEALILYLQDGRLPIDNNGAYAVHGISGNGGIHLTGVEVGPGMDRPRAGTHYPTSLGEFQSWFRSDADCLDYLEWLRWPVGFTCSACDNNGGWRLGDGRFMCAGCGDRSSVTAGTIFDRTRTPLTVWFTACWLFATSKDGISALSLKRTLEIGSYQTAWTMLHRLRSVLVRPGRDRLTGMVEVDETYHRR